MEKEFLLLKTTYAGEIALSWKEVVRLGSEKNLRFVFTKEKGNE